MPTTECLDRAMTSADMKQALEGVVDAANELDICPHCLGMMLLDLALSALRVGGAPSSYVVRRVRTILESTPEESPSRRIH